MKYTFLTGAISLSAAMTSLATTIQVGTGADSSFLVIDSPNIMERTYEVFYDFDAANPLGTDDLLTIIEAGDSLISFNYGGNPDNQFLTSILFDSVSEGSSSEFWGQWVAGGQAGVDSDTFMADPMPIPADSWTLGSGISAPFRIVEPGATDALVFPSDFATPPSFNPIPEPSGVVLLALGSVLFAGRRRR